VFTILRNGCSRSIGIGVQDAAEYAPDDAAFELVADDGRGDAAEEGQGAGVAGDPVGHLLGAGRLGVGVVRGSEGGDKELDLDDLAGWSGR